MRSRIDSRQKEVDKTDEVYDKKVDQIKIETNQKELEIKDKVNQEIARTLDHKQQKLQQFQKELKDHKEKLDTERLALGEKQDYEMKSMLTEFDHSYKERFNDAFSKASEINDRTRDTLSLMDADAIQEIQDTNHLSRKKMGVVTKTNEDLIAREQEAYLRTLNKNKAEYATILANEKMRFEKELSGLNADQANKASTKQEFQAKELQKKEQFFQRLIQQKEIGFKSKIKNLHEQHEVVLDKIKERFKVEIDKMLIAHSKRKEVIMTKVRMTFIK